MYDGVYLKKGDDIIKNRIIKFVVILFSVCIGLITLKLHKENVYPHECKVNHFKEKEVFLKKSHSSMYSCSVCGYGTAQYYKETTKMYQDKVDKINKEKNNLSKEKQTLKK